MSEVMKIEVAVQDVSGRMFLREHLGSGEGEGLSFTLARAIGMPGLFIEVQDGPTFLVGLTEDHVTEILTTYLESQGDEETADE